MSDNLAVRLVHDAAEAIRDAYDEDCGVPDAGRPTLDAVEWTPEARAAVVAVLHGLAKSAYPDRNSTITAGVATDLLRLAERVKEARNG